MKFSKYVAASFLSPSSALSEPPLSANGNNPKPKSSIWGTQNIKLHMYFFFLLPLPFHFLTFWGHNYCSPSSFGDRDPDYERSLGSPFLCSIALPNRRVPSLDVQDLRQCRHVAASGWKLSAALFPQRFLPAGNQVRITATLSRSTYLPSSSFIL